MRKLIESVQFTFSDELKLEIRNHILNLIQIESVSTIRFNLCEIFGACLLETDQDGSFYQIIQQMFSIETLCSTGLRLAYEIQVLQKFPIAQIFFPIVVQFMAHLNIEIRTECFRLLNQFLINYEDFQLMSESNDFATLLFQSFQKNFSPQGNPNEVEILFDLISQCIEHEINSFSSYHQLLLQSIVQNLQNTEIDRFIRFRSIIIIESIIKIDFDFIHDILVDCLVSFSSFSIQLCNEDPESEDYKITSLLVEEISDVEFSDEFFSNHAADILTLSINLIEANEFSQTKVGLSILESLFHTSPNELLDYEDAVIPLILKYLSVNDSLIFNSACDVAINFAKNLPDNLPQYIDTFVQILLPKNSLKSNLVLQEIFKNSPQLPSNNLIQFFVHQIQVSSPDLRDSVFGNNMLLSWESTRYGRSNFSKSSSNFNWLFKWRSISTITCSQNIWYYCENFSSTYFESTSNLDSSY